jgi:asparagine synthase (glutamine-hydrolysing)
MCGIGGIIYKNTKEPNVSELESMRRSLSKRGPDGHGIYTDKSVGLVHTRLSIIDSEGGHQPMKNDNNHVIVFNGEIYNYIEIRQSLKDKYNFKTESDTETILALYAVYGLDFVNHLLGMYAFALYDSASETIVIARDPFGIKPLYITDNANYFAFASEPKALISSGLSSPNLDFDVLRSVVRGNYVKGTYTPYPSIQRLNPGEMIVFEQGQKKSFSNRSFISRDAPRTETEASALINLEKCLMDSVNIHCRSDVGYGVFLSGGVDSSTIMQILSKLNKDRTDIKSYTAYFDSDTVSDERNYARAVAHATGASFHEVPFGQDDFFKLLPAIASYMDDPVADYAILPTWKLASVAAEEQKVILSGEGGDELFGGYGRYRKRWWKNWRKPKPKSSLCSPNWSDLQCSQAQDIAEYLPNDLLIKLDTCLMAHGLEGRTPFLDKAVSEFAFNLPDKLKLQGSTGKYLLKKWLDKELPIANPFRKKRGFTVPVGNWLSSDAKNISDVLIHNQFVQELLGKDDLNLIPKLMDTPKSATQCWPILYLTLWHAGKTGKLNQGNIVETIDG